jgi:hypothetical protein
MKALLLSAIVILSFCNDSFSQKKDQEKIQAQEKIQKKGEVKEYVIFYGKVEIDPAVVKSEKDRNEIKNMSVILRDKVTKKIIAKTRTDDFGKFKFKSIKIVDGLEIILSEVYFLYCTLPPMDDISVKPDPEDGPSDESWIDDEIIFWEMCGGGAQGIKINLRYCLCYYPPCPCDEWLKTKALKELDKSPKGEIRGSVWTPPKGETRIAAVGLVRDEKVMMTSRGGTIGGTVTLKTEEGEELASVVPDENGHFTIDFIDIATTVAVASTLVLTQLNSEGNTETSTTVEYLPGTPPEVVGIPVFTRPDVPFIENNQLNELAGSNFGEAAEVVIIDEGGEAILQETVSSSNSLNEYYTDAPVGEAQVFVRNDYGSSEPVEIGVYEFGVRAGKMNLVRNEQTNITAVYDGLPKGTRIVFTNQSPNVTVKPNGKGKASGNETIFVVKKSSGEVSMTLKAKQAGGWVLNYRLEFPESY